MSASRQGLWKQARNLLCVRLDNLGDVLMTTPAIHALKQAIPGRRITLLASPAGAQAARHVPDIDAVLVHEAPWMQSPSVPCPAEDLSLCRALTRQDFDAAVIFTVYSQSPLPAALLCYLAGIPLRLAHCRENPYHLLSDWVPEPEPGTMVRHEVQRQLDLVATAGATTQDVRMRFAVPAQAHAVVDRLLAGAGLLPGENVVVVHPGATAPSRRYAPEGFALVASALAMRHNCRVLVTGGHQEVTVAEQVCAMAAAPGRVTSLADSLDLEELAALIARSRLLISNNSGPVHLACAVGTPVVDLYALTNPQHTPWQVPSRLLYHDVPCKFCYKSVCPLGHNDCLQRVEPAAVLSAACELLEDAAESGTRRRCSDLRRSEKPTQEDAETADTVDVTGARLIQATVEGEPTVRRATGALLS